MKFTLCAWSQAIGCSALFANKHYSNTAHKHLVVKIASFAFYAKIITGFTSSKKIPTLVLFAYEMHLIKMYCVANVKDFTELQRVSSQNLSHKNILVTNAVQISTLKTVLFVYRHAPQVNFEMTAPRSQAKLSVDVYTVNNANTVMQLSKIIGNLNATQMYAQPARKSAKKHSVVFVRIG